MHGRPRLPPGHVPDAAKVEANRLKASQLKGAISMVVSAKGAGNFDERILKVAAGVLLKNPDVYTLWNYRREALGHILDSGGESAKALAASEAKLTETCLAQQPKSYATWHHRRWVVERGHTDLEQELELVNTLLSADARNFHGWSYRFFVVALMGRSDEDELEYTHQLITSDFSNFSAWHYRSLLLPRVHAARGHRTIQELATSTADPHSPSERSGGDEDSAGSAAPAATGRSHQGVRPLSQTGAGAAPRVQPGFLIPLYELASEFELLKTALCMDPGDSSAWSYHRWLLEGVVQHASQAGRSDADASVLAAAHTQLEAEARFCEELMGEVEAEVSAEDRVGHPAAKWPMLSLAGIRHLQAEQPTLAGAQKQAFQVQERGIYELLKGLDPCRKGYYEDQMAKIDRS